MLSKVPDNNIVIDFDDDVRYQFVKVLSTHIFARGTNAVCPVVEHATGCYPRCCIVRV